MTEDFGYPLPADALGEFTCKRAGSALGRPMRHAGEIIAANGFVVIRAHRGRWLDRDYPEAPADFMVRINSMPWDRYQTLDDTDWRTLADARAMLYKRGRLGMLRDGTAKLAPSPVWKVGSALVRLTLLQLIDRLPRCEVWAGSSHVSLPLWFRFTGGRGAIAADTRLKESSFSIFQPVFNEWTGQFEKRRPENQGAIRLPIPYRAPWPPPEPLD